MMEILVVKMVFSVVFALGKHRFLLWKTIFSALENDVFEHRKESLRCFLLHKKGFLPRWKGFLSQKNVCCHTFAICHRLEMPVLKGFFKRCGGVAAKIAKTLFRVCLFHRTA